MPNIADGSQTLPYHIMVIPLTNTQCTSISKNPLIFWPHFIKKYSLALNSHSLPSIPITLESNWMDNTRAYRHFQENMGLSNSASSNGIDPFSFRFHDFTMSFDLTGDSCLGEHNHRPTTGTLDLNLVFDKVLPEPITLLVIASYEACLKLDNQEVSINYSL